MLGSVISGMVYSGSFFGKNPSISCVAWNVWIVRKFLTRSWSL